MSEKKAAWFRVPASAAGAVMKAPGLRTEQSTSRCKATVYVPHGTMEGHPTMKAYQIITAGHIVAVLFALDITDALAKAAAAGIPPACEHYDQNPLDNLTKTNNTNPKEDGQMSNSIPTINIIPEDYEGNPRDALGYAWADLDARIPGEDVTLPRTDKGIDYRGYIAERFGASAAIHNNNQYGFLRPPKGRVVALINCMWCGGLSGVVYLPESNHNQREAAPVNLGDTLAETAMREQMAETAALAEQDARNAQHPGYCTKCHTYCYGDCESQ